MNFGGMRPPKVRARLRARDAARVTARVNSPRVCRRCSVRQHLRSMRPTRWSTRVEMRGVFSKAVFGKEGALEFGLTDTADAAPRGLARRRARRASRVEAYAAASRQRILAGQSLLFCRPREPQVLGPTSAGTETNFAVPPLTLNPWCVVTGRQQQVLHDAGSIARRDGRRDQKGVSQGGHQTPP